jgi:hypothetical protein
MGREDEERQGAPRPEAREEAMIVPAANARLKRVLRAGFTEDYDEAETDGTEAWQGWHGVRLDTRTRRRITPGVNGDMTTVRLRMMTASADLGFDWAPGDRAFVEVSAGVEERLVVVGIDAEPAEMPGVPRFAVLEMREL